MGHTDHRTLPTGRAAVRWFLFLIFFHLLPVPWFMFVAAGLAADGFPRNPAWATALLEKIADGYRQGRYFSIQPSRGRKGPGKGVIRCQR